jgi:hypothetical protein
MSYKHLYREAQQKRFNAFEGVLVAFFMLPELGEKFIPV